MSGDRQLPGVAAMTVSTLSQLIVSLLLADQAT
jgi:hypothetical protein